MSYERFSPEQMVAFVAGVDWSSLTVDQASEIQHALRNYIQTIWALDAGLEQKIRAIVACGERVLCIPRGARVSN